MTERPRRPAPPIAGVSAQEAQERRARDERIERSLGRAVALGLPATTAAAAAIVGLAAGVGSALLVIAAGVLLGAIALFWASVRTLSGDAPLAMDFETLSARRHGVDGLLEEKRRLLRALKDLEGEHELGKIDDADYAAIVSRTRDEAKAVMRKMDVQVAPLRAEAERLAAEYLEKRRLGGAADPGTMAAAGSAESAPPGLDRVDCLTCGASNEADAAFCKQCGSPVKERSRARA